MVYLADKRQELHFVQVFRCARKTGLVQDDTNLKFIGFGTMNGKDGKPFKTREGGVMRLEKLVSDIEEKMYQKISENQTMSEEEARDRWWHSPQSNTGICQTRPPRIMYLTLTGLSLLREIPDRISSIRSCASNLF